MRHRWIQGGVVRNTVDGSEIRRSPVEVGCLPHYLQDLQGLITSQVVSRISEPSTV